ncbi:hypothetical protein [Neisseria perflava]|uniref:hypothetical protein n=1 Tax=Neisseria perflava TaxID=33053 RepID=UPI00209EEED3|nr:hypothetical protein [Neisseria perflava]MCP1661040.1 hypothetical protein [Neisseria perflava]MCP1773030.1 hypothetical protein [Neisseria perflava]
MKKIIFTAIIAATASIAAAKGAPQQPWNHANDAGQIIGLTEVTYPTTIHSAKHDDRIKYAVAPTGVRVPGDIRYNDTHSRLARDGAH